MRLPGPRVGRKRIGSRALLVVSLWSLVLGLEAASAQELDSERLASLSWRPIGPAITSGRITGIDATGDGLIYAASATGGVWKSTNRGVTWEPVFEREGAPSVGDVALSPSNPNVVWVGTGEDFNARSNSWGDGVYKSEDGGKTWRHVGLTETRHIGRVIAHPTDPETAYVAALGSLWGAGEERGLFKTVDGGGTWSKVLYISEHTGIADVVMDPRDPDVLYAGAHQRERRNWSFLGGGPEGGLFKSTDGGKSWEKLTNGLPRGDLGRIGVSVCLGEPDVVYAAIDAAERGGIFRSDDRGASWERRSSEVTTRWSYGIIRCDPEDPDRVYVPLTRSVVSEDGGKTFRELVPDGVHVDHRALWIDPRDSRRLLLGTDGGLYTSYDRGENWDFAPNLPVTQFYTVSVDMREPYYYVYGGTQDNNSLGGPSGTRNLDGIVNDDWFMTVPGDGFHVQIDPEEPHIVYTESQYGRLVRFDTRTGERRLIQPQPPEGEKYRWNWSSPVLISRHDSRTLYFAANRVFRSPDRGDSWEVVSPDLTRQLDQYELPLQGKLWPRETSIALHQGTSDYGNITTVSESPLERGRLVVGTDDGQISVTSDDGSEWTTVKVFPGVPEQTRVSRVVSSSAKRERIYAVFDAHKDNDFRPYVVKSEDFGESWLNITGDLPDHGSTRVIAEHPRNPNLLVVGTEITVFVSITGGGAWVELKNNLPTVPVHDLVIHPRENDLVLGTHGRGFWILDDMSLLDELTPQVLSSEAHLARVRPATQMHRFDRGRRSQGERYFTAPNPPDGAILTYYVNPDVMPPSEGSTNGSDGAPTVELDILDAEGNLVRRLEPPQGKDGTGVQRLVWDLRHPLASEAGEGESPSFFTGRLKGPFVLPGTYRARLRVGELERTTSVVVEADPLVTITDEDRRVWHGTLLALDQMSAAANAALSTSVELKETMDELERLVRNSPSPDQSLLEEIESIDSELEEILEALRGEGERSRAEQPGTPPLAEGVRELYANIEIATARPTEDQRRRSTEAHAELTRIVERLNLLRESRISELYPRLDAAGVPWTLGRRIALPPTPPH